jgi:hypothetical protein
VVVLWKWLVIRVPGKEFVSLVPGEEWELWKVLMSLVLEVEWQPWEVEMSRGFREDATESKVLMSVEDETESKVLVMSA